MGARRRKSVVRGKLAGAVVVLRRYVPSLEIRTTALREKSLLSGLDQMVYLLVERQRRTIIQGYQQARRQELAVA